MAEYVWQHDIKGEAERLRLMSHLLDSSSELHLLRTGVATGWHCLEIGAGNGSLSRWLAHPNILDDDHCVYRNDRTASRMTFTSHVSSSIPLPAIPQLLRSRPA